MLDYAGQLGSKNGSNQPRSIDMASILTADQHRVKTLRLRRKGPQWRQVALFVFVADALLAAAAWVAVDFFLR